MDPLISLFLALCAGAALVLVGYFALGLHRRAHQETLSGIEAMNTLKWREFAELALAHFRAQGFEQLERNHRAGDGGYDLLLERNGLRHLVSIKFSSAYELDATNVREFDSVLKSHSAAGGFILTTGLVMKGVEALAERQRIVLLHGDSLWHALAPHLSQDTVHDAIESAHAQWRLRLGQIGAAGVVLSLAVFGGSLWLGTGKSSRAAAAAAASPAPTPAAVLAQETEVPNPLPPGLTEEQATQRRQQVMDQVGALSGVLSVGWTTKSTLIIGMSGSDSASEQARTRVIQQACVVLLRFEELRFTRLQLHQLDATRPEDARVHWQRCGGN